MSETWITLSFELKRHKGRFIIFAIISIAVASLSGLLPYFIDPDALADTFNGFISSQLSFISYLIIFGACFFFGGIIAEEFQYKTYLILFPKTHKLKIVAGKFLGNCVLFLTVLSIFYGYSAVLGFIFYQTITIEFFYSYLFCIFYSLTISTFILLISSFMKTATSAIVISVILLFMVFDTVSTFINLALPYVEPVYMITYNASFITNIFNFPEVRYTEISFMFHMRIWMTPTIITGITMQLIYIVFDLVLSYLIFQLREL